MTEWELEPARGEKVFGARAGALKRAWAKSRALRMVLLIFLLSRLAFYVAAFFGSRLVPEALTEPGRVAVNGPLSLAMHWRWDGKYYYSLAVSGYGPNAPNVFFPLFPLLTFGLATLLGGRFPRPLPLGSAEIPTLLAGVLVVDIAALVAFWLLFVLARDETGDEATAQRAVLYTAIFPFALYYAVPYTESLYLATSIGVFLAARRRKWILAGLAAGLVSATRPVGILLAPVLAFEMFLAWRRGDLHLGEWPRVLLGLVLAPLGLVLFMLDLWWRTGDPLVFLRGQQSGWHHELVFPLRTLARGIKYTLFPSLVTAPDIYARGVINTLIVLGFLGIMLVSLRQWRPAYVLYGVLLFTQILSSPLPGQWAMHSLGRYIMVLFPVYITLARWGKRPALHQAILLLWLPLFGLLTALYVRWYAVG